jgi:hypothetical protein
VQIAATTGLGQKTWAGRYFRQGTAICPHSSLSILKLPRIDDKPPVGVLQTFPPVRAVEIKIEATERAHDYWGRAPNVCNGSRARGPAFASGLMSLRTSCWLLPQNDQYSVFFESTPPILLISEPPSETLPCLASGISPN